jgi:hypothetical protein
MANSSLPQDKLTEFRPISVSAVHVLARLSARRAVQEELRSQGESPGSLRGHLGFRKELTACFCGDA